MLKALQLAGFKSFADKTLFELDSGITVVVGPNGSGKSNVVDAIKWVLGEQSVKSLRGKEMADVIFNGSASRHPMNAAEATLIFDNTKRVLPLEEDEVRLTRRVYRGGEGEYLINDQAVRRRDIRDLVAGAASGAYSIIEQGKVDALLQASPRDRRLIFEEAAGVSRFRMKKLETQRRLERVEINLQRLKDIVDEVESRLRSIRNQAKRARQYQEYKSRLQNLRTQVALVDWRMWSSKLDQLDERTAQLKASIGSMSAELGEAEAEQTRCQSQLATTDDVSRRAAAEAANVREQLARDLAEVDNQLRRLASTARQIAEQRATLAETRERSADLNQSRLAVVRQLQAARDSLQENRESTQALESKLAALQTELESLRSQNESKREGYLTLIRDQAALQQEITTAETAVAADQQAIDRLQQRVEALTARRNQFTNDQQQAGTTKREAAESADAATRAVFQAKADLAAARQNLSAAADRRHEAAGELNRQRERADVLRELEERQEGIDSGAQYALSQAANQTGAFSQVLGLVAELLHVNVDVAPIIEIALGERMGDVVIPAGEPFLAALAESGQTLPGRLRLISLNRCRPAPKWQLDSEPGVIGRADRFVECADDLRPLAEDLLGATWIVESLSAARRLIERIAEQQGMDPHAEARLQFITLDGEVLSADGRIILGGHPQIAGPIARRSELRSLQEKIGSLETRQADLDAEYGASSAAVTSAEATLDDAMLAQREAEATLADCARREELLALNLAETTDELTQAQGDLELVATRRQRTAANLARQQAAYGQLEGELTAREREIATTAKSIIHLDSQRKTQETETTAAQVSLAKSEERESNLDAQVRQLERDQHERREGLRQGAERLRALESERAEAELAALRAESRLAILFLRKDKIAGEEFARLAAVAQLRAALSHANTQVNSLREVVRRDENEVHRLELAAGELRGKRDALAQRMREEYQINLAEMSSKELSIHRPEAVEPAAVEDTSADAPAADEEMDSVEQEIETLRNKLSRLGNVNLEALDELDGLESRYTELSEQYNDLVQARSQLLKIIEKINGESRRMFTETLTNVREYFGSLFRKLFGGGQAEIIMEEGDPLEAGVDIIAQPPGKELRNISLLSGGEKTLTCVALLMALFRNRPSPFCVLDEVDAALDEANIDRFTNVLREFLSITQFIVVTHSKKTMTCANTLYGITMQESGISKRVSVKFEDVTEDGRIIKSNDEQAA